MTLQGSLHSTHTLVNASCPSSQPLIVFTLSLFYHTHNSLCCCCFLVVSHILNTFLWSSLFRPPPFHSLSSQAFPYQYIGLLCSFHHFHVHGRRIFLNAFHSTWSLPHHCPLLISCSSYLFINYQNPPRTVLLRYWHLLFPFL